jgi:hypothetical protein
VPKTLGPNGLGVSHQHTLSVGTVRDRRPGPARRPRAPQDPPAGRRSRAGDQIRVTPGQLGRHGRRGNGTAATTATRMAAGGDDLYGCTGLVDRVRSSRQDVAGGKVMDAFAVLAYVPAWHAAPTRVTAPELFLFDVTVRSHGAPVLQQGVMEADRGHAAAAVHDGGGIDRASNSAEIGLAPLLLAVPSGVRDGDCGRQAGALLASTAGSVRPEW